MQFDSKYRLLFEALQEGTVQAVQQAASRIFGSAVSVTDNAFRVLSADVDPGSTDDMLERDQQHLYVSNELLQLFREHQLITSLTKRPHETIVVDWGYFKDHPHITTGIFWQDQILGSVTVLVDSAAYTPEQDEALQACAKALSLVMRASESGKKTLSVDRDHFVSKLFHGAARADDLHRATEQRYYLQSETNVILATELMPDEASLNRIAANPRVLLYQDEGVIYLLAEPDSPELAEVQQRIENRGYRYGMSSTFSNPLLAGRMAKQAAAALAYGNHSEQSKAAWAFPEHVLEMLINDTSVSTDFVHPAILEMEQYDARNKTEYLYTLRMWFQEKMDYAATAKAMNLHRNSLYYRMQRIRDLFHLDLDDMNTDVHLYLSLLGLSIL